MWEECVEVEVFLCVVVVVVVVANAGTAATAADSRNARLARDKSMLVTSKIRVPGRSDQILPERPSSVPTKWSRHQKNAVANP